MNTDSSAIARFRRAYSVTIFNVLALAGAFAATNIRADWQHILYSIGGVVIATLALLPYILRGGFTCNIRLAISISVLWTLAFGLLIAFLIYDFIKVEYSSRIPPDGYMLGFIVFVPIFTLVCFCPWLITLLRGVICLATKNLEMSEHQAGFKIVEQ